MPSLGIHGSDDVTIDALPNEGQQTMANSISVAIASDQSAVAVDGSAVTQPVSGPLTDTQLRAAPVIISGAVVTI